MEDCTPHGPVEGKAVRDLRLFVSNMVQSIEDHEKNWKGLQGAEDPAPPEPITWCTNPIIMVACSDDSSDQDQSHFNIKPFLYDMALHPRDLQ
jgi:hypothetical protein